MTMTRVKMLMKNKKKITRKLSQRNLKKKDRMVVINLVCTRITLNF